jgi:hypothetical protein
VNPFWPFLGVMFGGAWLSWPWFVVNGIAVGSPTRRRELLIVVGAFVVSGLLLLILVSLAGSGRIPESGVPYALLTLTVFKLGVTYWLHALQSRTFEVYEYYGGIARQGFLVILAAYFLSQSAAPKLAAAAPLLVLWLR